MTTQPTKIKLGFLGVHPGPFGIRGFATADSEGVYTPIPGVELTAMAEINEEAATKAQTMFGFQRRYSDYKEMLAKEDLDAVVILLPTFLHKQATIDCLDAGVHVLCEKPPANDYQEMLEIEQAVARSGKQYMFVRQSRFSANAQATRQLVMDGKLGSVYAGEAKWVRTRGRQVLGDTWRTDKSKGGGVLIDLGIHGLDLLWYCMGNPMPIEVSASEMPAFKQYAPNPDVYTADDNFFAWIRFENGAVIQGSFAFGMNQVGEKKEGESEYSDEWQSYKIFGTEGGVDIFKNQLVSGPNNSFTVSELPRDASLIGVSDLVTQAKHFAECVAQNKRPQNSVDQAVQLMKMLSALAKSAETQRSIRLEDF
ncbi:Gfo/Idh/MocA family protein [Cerasicoccus fimbriatus]|uniref:Gfo/Idh/MocA family protein n=1 Tax=Cerasicoccus fimbriatus TaxID=3014554 RepID=UPI0022B4C4F8|nr:Gfo/Idh/MocA family oxidoreductase [Cerasicoccus sp. TK19100]